MSQPTVVCVLLVNGREAMVKRAIASFRAQTYAAKRLLVFDNGDPLFGYHHKGVDLSFLSGVHYCPSWKCGTIGSLRNAANSVACWDALAELIVHWDSDDWSHPRRLEEQVALLEASGKMCVGYNKVLFWDTARDKPEAWIYSNGDARYAIGASFLYRRELWEKQPFDDAPHEDNRWWRTPLISGQCVGVSALAPVVEPRMICQIHGTNTEPYGRAARTEPEWTRVPVWDTHCMEKMKL